MADRWETDERELYRATFDEDAEAYDATRPVAPAAVFDDLVTLASLEPGSAVVEIGPGTGQATTMLAARGLRVLAVELGANLAARARQNLASFADVEVITSAFETWDPNGRTFDAVFACNSFHWVDATIRFAKAASVLSRGGHLVILATPWVVPDDADPFWWEVQEDYVAAGGQRVDPATKHPDGVTDLGPAIRKTALFEEATIRRYRFDVQFTSHDYARNLSTQSGIKEFPPDRRAPLIDAIRRRVDAHGGIITAHLLAILTVARRTTIA